ncbi:MAG TPA: glycine betaine ABC transporter substrate-binding protein [Methylomirabilota bacterium]|nr:glycine betaine ABC transporter substrate-binding protein [Methylomirabilota bacterium]
MQRARRIVALAAGVLLATLTAEPPPAAAADRPVVRVGSKSFAESYILAELIAQIAEQTGEAGADRKFGLGGTGLVYTALAAGELDVYPEYTGTIARAILKDPGATTLEAIRARMAERGLVVGQPLGFDNAYALAVSRATATRLGLRTLSDLRGHRELTAAFDPGFLERDDGWPGLRRHYGLDFRDVRIMEHALAYRALASGGVDVITVFTTDGQLAREAITVLADDRKLFPDYAAVLLARRAMVEQRPRTWAALEQRLAGRLDNTTMARLNAEVDLDGRSAAAVAAGFLGVAAPPGGGERRAMLLRQIPALTLQHLVLVGISLAVAVALGVPLGILAARRRRLGQLELMGVGVLQTIPALALLSFMIPLFGIGRVPALVALCLYALLPIVRNTYAGLVSLDPQLVDVAAVIGLDGWKRLGWVELPLASITILAGIKTAAILTVGTATLAAFIGGGGYGTLIVTGLALNDPPTILAGAVPSALMALAVHALFEGLDRLAVPRGLRTRAQSSS